MERIIALSKRPRKILVIKPSSLGDVVHGLACLNALHRCFPKAEIHWVIARGLEGLLEGHPMIKRLWIIDKDQWKKIGRIGPTIMEIGRLADGLRQERFDLVIDLQGLLRSGLIAQATGSAMRIGFREAREGSPLAYTCHIVGGRDIHAVTRYLKIPAALGCPVAPVAFPLPPVEETDVVRHVTGDGSPYALLVPGARWRTKQWPAERFGEVAVRLGMRSYVIGGAADKKLGEIIEKKSRGAAVSLAGATTLSELIAIIRMASFMITNDSGPMHLAAACSVPVVALFGPTNPVRTGPYGPGHIVLQAKHECTPCYKRVCDRPKCLLGITVDQVLAATQKVINVVR
jgi:lipopolysaccharide heptosyltransferase I